MDCSWPISLVRVRVRVRATVRVRARVRVRSVLSLTRIPNPDPRLVQAMKEQAQFLNKRSFGTSNVSVQVPW